MDLQTDGTVLAETACFILHLPSVFNTLKVLSHNVIVAHSVPEPICPKIGK